MSNNGSDLKSVFIERISQAISSYSQRPQWWWSLSKRKQRRLVCGHRLSWSFAAACKLIWGKLAADSLVMTALVLNRCDIMTTSASLIYAGSAVLRRTCANNQMSPAYVAWHTRYFKGIMHPGSQVHAFLHMCTCAWSLRSGQKRVYRIFIHT